MVFLTVKLSELLLVVVIIGVVYIFYVKFAKILFDLTIEELAPQGFVRLFPVNKKELQGINITVFVLFKLLVFLVVFVLLAYKFEFNAKSFEFIFDEVRFEIVELFIAT